LRSWLPVNLNKQEKEMEMNKLILCPNTQTSPAMTSGDRNSCNEMIWENGESLDDSNYDFSNLEFICEDEDDEMTDYALTDMGCSLVSERLKIFFDSEGFDNI
jgi:hypothetical protein